MATALVRVQVDGFDTSRPGDPVASVTLSGIVLQAGESALWAFVDDVAALVGAAQNVDTVKTTKFETVSTVI